jgi:fumarate hydratase class I
MPVLFGTGAAFKLLLHHEICLHPTPGPGPQVGPLINLLLLKLWQAFFLNYAIFFWSKKMLSFKSVASNCTAAVSAAAFRFPRQLYNRALSAPAFRFQDLFESEKPESTLYRKLTSDFVSVIDGPLGKKFLKVEPEGLTLLAKQAMIDIAHLLRPAHLEQLSSILKDPEASPNDRFVALELLKNANVAAGMILPSCQDTGTGICMGKRGQYVLTDGEDEAAISRGIFDAYTTTNLRYSQAL